MDMMSIYYLALAVTPSGRLRPPSSSLFFTRERRPSTSRSGRLLAQGEGTWQGATSINCGRGRASFTLAASKPHTLEVFSMGCIELGFPSRDLRRGLYPTTFGRLRSGGLK